VSAPIRLDVAKAFASTPGGRYRSEGKFSGEEFRQDHVEPLVDSGNDVEIDLDGPEGFTSSFLEEVFGGLVRKYGRAIKDRVRAVADARPGRARKAERYMQRALDAAK
jgi:hypothetical protein